ncbi:MAG: hypothetical protein A2663_01590 [Candidatus Buchananbacteria bacterium RIFCSPHIGHO2_01_FULL_46_12]|uniref:Uncharacterized protein n=2 Tax=Candidatus Buchananiibacteriota TaxID=1817903 RepID=A0A1G1Y4Z5_9BACT|nr:MAG: hypothetical protein A2663_01590 [Candidatus Buchananbacteria bacterium RIFCSPHIGHO2_01_FULL_46_12]OGY56773.1 MAG: hypothetical protein A3H67_03870 [Candidatus Buchananbacteria bacterium RIFCSPLOWO2_02_FULL_46_11b]
MKKPQLALLTFFVMLSLCSLALVPALTTAAAGSISEDIKNQLEPVQTVYGGDEPSDTQFAETIAEIIGIVLGFLGIIFLVLLIYAGFLWMTAAGSEEKVKKAKDIMIAAIIGVTIILTAYAITWFVFNNLLKATGINESGL